MGQFIQEKENVSVGNGQITVEALIGNLQQGATRISLDSKIIGRGATRVHAYVGKGSVKGTLRVEAAATDINTAPTADTIPLTIYILEDGKTTWSKTYDPSSKDGEMILFEINIQL